MKQPKYKLLVLITKKKVYWDKEYDRTQGTTNYLLIEEY